MKKYEILCYGDSNTWGTEARKNTADKEFRYDRSTRWPCVLQKGLGAEYAVTEEGLGYRTTVFTQFPDFPYRNGQTMLEGCLRSHYPLDLVIIMLGTNDLRTVPLPSEEKLERGMEALASQVRGNTEIGPGGSKAPELLIVAPPFITPSQPDDRTEVWDIFHGSEGEAMSRRFPEIYRSAAEKYNGFFLNAQEFTVPDPRDGVHLDASSHIRLGKAVAEKVREIRRCTDG